MSRRILSCALVVSGATRAFGQTSTSMDPLNEFISLAASAASALVPGSTPSTLSTTTSASSIPSSSSTSTSSPTASASTPAAVVGSGGGLDGVARSVIIAVAVIAGLLIIGMIVGCLLCCCHRRRRRARAGRNVTSAPLKKDEWDARNASHHGYVAPVHDGVTPETTQRQTESLIFPATSQRHTEPLVFERDEASRPLTSDHPALRDGYGNAGNNANSENPFVPVPPPTRKPIPNGNHHQDRALMAGAGVAGAAAGAAAYRHHENQKDHSYGKRPKPDRYSNGSGTSQMNLGAASRQDIRHHNDGALMAGAGAAGSATGADALHHHEHQNPNASFTQPAASDQYTNDLGSHPSNTTMVSGRDAHDHHDGALMAGAGVAGAAAGAAAYRHHKHGKDGEYEQRPISDHHPNALTSHPSNPDIGSERDPYRPPTPFGLAAFGSSPKPRRHGSFDPTVQDRQYDGMNRSAGEFEPNSQTRRSPYNDRGMGAFEPSVRDHEYNYSNRDSFEPIARNGNYDYGRQSTGSYYPVAMETPRSSYGQGRHSGGSLEAPVPDDGTAYPYSRNIPYPTAAQRHSLHEREMAGPEREVLVSPTVPSRSPHRASFGEVTQPSNSSNSPRVSTGTGALHENRGPLRGRHEAFAGAGDQNPMAVPQQTLYHRPGLRPHSDRVSYTDSSSDESGRSLPPNVSWGVPWKGSAHGIGVDRRRHSGSPMRTFGRDGREQRLRFSDTRDEWRYDNENAVGQAL